MSNVSTIIILLRSKPNSYTNNLNWYILCSVENFDFKYLLKIISLANFYEIWSKYRGICDEYFGKSEC